MQEQDLTDSRLRVKIVGGGCSGFSYDLSFDEVVTTNETGDKVSTPARIDGPISPMDVLISSRGITIIVDQMSLMYLMGTEIDYVDTLQGAGFKFNNPNVTSMCGCGSSFQV